MFKKCLLISAMMVGLFSLTACEKDEYTETKEKFIKRCAQNSVSQQTCSCIYGELEKKYTKESLFQFIKTQNFPDDINRTVLDVAGICVN